MPDALDSALTEAADLVTTKRMTKLLAGEFIRGYMVHLLQAQMQAVGGTPDWRNLQIELRDEMATSLQDKTKVLFEAIYADPDQHPGLALRNLVDQLLLDVLLLATQPAGVEFLGVTWKVRADGSHLRLFEGKDVIFEYPPPPPPAPRLEVPKKKVILPGQG